MTTDEFLIILIYLICWNAPPAPVTANRSNKPEVTELVEDEIRVSIIWPLLFSVAIRAVVNGPGESFVKALAKWSMSPLVELNLLGLFDIISERQIHFVAERMTEHNLVNFIVARDAPPI